MTKLTKAQDEVIEMMARNTNHYTTWAEISRGTTANLSSMTLLRSWGFIVGDNYHYALLQNGRAYAIERGWLAAEAAPVAAAAKDSIVSESGTLDEDAEIVVGCEVISKRDGMLVECGEIGIVKHIDSIGKFRYATVVFGNPTREIEISFDWLVRWIPDNQQPAAALPAPDSQFVDAATHVAIDSERKAIKLDNPPTDPQSTKADYAQALDDVCGALGNRDADVLKLESELQAARAEIARLRNQHIGFLFGVSESLRTASHWNNVESVRNTIAIEIDKLKREQS